MSSGGGGYESSDISCSCYSDDSSYSDIDSILNDDDEKDNNKLVDDEFEVKAVKCFRMFVFFLLVSAMAAAGASTWYFITEDEQDDFLNDYDNFAEELSDGSTQTVFGVVEDSKAMSSSITNIGLTSKSEWPFFVDNNFHIVGNSYRNRTGAELVVIAPIVNIALRSLWANFSIHNQQWVSDGVEWRKEYEGDDDDDDRYDVVMDSNIPTDIYRLDNVGNPIVEDPNAWMLAPVWQMARAPINPSIVNYNLLSQPIIEEAFDAIKKYNGRVLTKALNMSDIFGDDYDDATQISSVNVNGTGSPTSLLIEPILVDFENDNRNRLGGALITVLSWEVLLSSFSIHDEKASLIAVLKNDGGLSCNNQMFTFSFQGNVATYIGDGDLHDVRFNHHEQIYNFAPFLQMSNNDCTFTLHVYPTSDMYEQYTTNKPLVITSVIVIVFFCTSIVFCLYDCAVHMRQRRILQIASQSERILSILYPKTIRDRLFGSILPGMPSAFNSGDLNEHSSSSHIKKNSKIKKTNSGKKSQPQAAKTKLKTYLTNDDTGTTDKIDYYGNDGSVDMFDTKPIADLFPNTTVMFGDIAGFTAWSSVREPAQVFTLLETVYRAFDGIAKKRRVFKVETVGDCYVAVTGLPEPRRDHAVAMVRFARECLMKFNELAGKLETHLGPDTGDLELRIGLHSGPVTAGVLRGDKSRFQLFGDTVNTAARIESTGRRNRIHMSRETAELLQLAGKGAWLDRREEAVEAKGKGRLQTYWLAEISANQNGIPSSQMNLTDHSVSDHGSVLDDDDEQQQPKTRTSIVRGTGGGGGVNSTSVNANGIPSKNTTTTTTTGTTDDNNNNNNHGTSNVADELEKSLPIKVQRLVHWNVDVLTRLLKQVVVKRRAKSGSGFNKSRKYDDVLLTKLENEVQKKIFLLDEVVEIIPLPQFDTKIVQKQEDPEEFELSSNVIQQARQFVVAIAALHPDNAFHNFEHASHVMMSVSKLLSRIIAPDEVLHAQASNIHNNGEKLASNLHDHTYGITSDPLTQFSVILSALIHDVDHRGVSNFQLIKENDIIASKFRNKSVAEQNSIILAWDTLMEPRFKDFRRCIYSDKHEFQRFRQLITNSVLATDIFDKELNALRRNRWDIAFKSEDYIASSSPEITASKNNKINKMDSVNRKATIVIEHLIQASDVAHTMQHWHVYRKWNERLFHEMTVAFKNGRMAKNPAENWYKGELGFYDNYIIPLAKKLKDCGVFGVSSEEYLNYALENRNEWEIKGEEVVKHLIETYQPPEEEEEKDDEEEEEKEEKNSKEFQQQQQQQERRKSDLVEPLVDPVADKK